MVADDLHCFDSMVEDIVFDHIVEIFDCLVEDSVFDQIVEDLRLYGLRI